MQITLSLPDEVGQELKTLPNPELFVSGLVKAALQYHQPTPPQSDLTWAAFFAKRNRLLAESPDELKDFMPERLQTETYHLRDPFEGWHE